MTYLRSSSEVDGETISVVVASQLRGDTDILSRVLRERDIRFAINNSWPEIEACIEQSDSILICTQEAFTRSFREGLAKFLQRQPSWSQLPIIFIFDQTQDGSFILNELQDVMSLSVTTILHRPMRMLEFITVLDNSLITRSRQLKIRDNIEYQRELQRELNHRVKNTLATFMAIYQISMRQSDSLGDFQSRFSNRIQALGAVHNVLHEDDEGKRSIGEIVQALLSPYVSKMSSRITIEGERFILGRQAVHSFALILNELVTNAAKYGSLSNADGTVKIRWQTAGSPDDTLNFEWRERNGPTVSKPKVRGYGTRFIEASARGLGAQTTFRYQPKGFVFVMKAPVSALEPNFQDQR